MTTLKDGLIDAALMHVPFDGWSETAFRAAIDETGASPAEARAAFPRGAVDLALAFHKRDDARMTRKLNQEDLSALRYRDRVAHAVRTRIRLAEENREAVRRAVTLFALPMHAADGTRALWGTADAIWLALGDASQDVNWYTKRAILSGVYSSTVLYWLGDQSEESRDTWEFLDRRIEDVMRVEKAKAAVRDNPVLSRLMAGPNMILSRIKAPPRMPPEDLPGYWSGSEG
jgi:ubiquinone biosynthesis protein COQ9